MIDDNTHTCSLHSQYYQIFVKDFNSLLPFLCVFLDAHNDEMRRLCLWPDDNSALCQDMRTLFTSLSDIYQCWLTSQYFKREFQAASHQFSSQLKHIVTSSVGRDGGAAGCKRHQVPGRSKFQSRKQPNFILLCLEILLPVVEKLVSKEDHSLMEMCASKLGMVCIFVCMLYVCVYIFVYEMH